ncbi:MAG: hypothetical protein JWR48_7087 [Mycobacterium sp.]|jgi:hypothetical protein|nr:hypothetical protein [Mycobacterium sp.]
MMAGPQELGGGGDVRVDVEFEYRPATGIHPHSCLLGSPLLIGYSVRLPDRPKPAGPTRSLSDYPPPKS